MSVSSRRSPEDVVYLRDDATLNEVTLCPLGGTGRIVVKHFAWVLVEEIGLDTFKGLVTNPLDDMKVAPFYGCYILRPSDALGLDENPGRSQYLERIIDACSAEAVNFPGRLSFSEKLATVLVRHSIV